MLILNGKIVLDSVFLTFILKAVPFKHISHPPKKRGCSGCDRMVVGFTTTCAIGAYHH
jgi:hypothetical protein